LNRVHGASIRLQIEDLPIGAGETSLARRVSLHR
jgi:hypothetical protein